MPRKCHLRRMFWISSTVWGFSSAERSPGSSPRYTERNTRRITLAFLVLGSAETKWIFDGASGLPHVACYGSNYFFEGYRILQREMIAGPFMEVGSKK